MSRDLIPLSTPDLSAFTKSLAQQLQDRPRPPGHLSLMNMLARAAGYSNVQHLRAARGVGTRPAGPATAAFHNHRLVERTLRQFDTDGRLERWHAKQSVQDLALWAFWARIPAGRSMTERETNDVLNAWHHFGDPAILRRSLVAQGFLSRKVDGTDYRRLDRVPTAEARVLLNDLAARRRANTGHH